MREHLFALENVAKLLPIEKLHDQDPCVFDGIALEIEHAHDVLVRQKSADLVFALEPLESDLVLGDVLVEDLYGDPRVRLLVDALIDATHTAVRHDAS